MKLKEWVGIAVVSISALLFAVGMWQSFKGLPPEQQVYRLRYTVVTSESEDARTTADTEEEHKGIEAARAKAHFIASTKCLQGRIRVERTHPTIREVESVEQGKAARKRNCAETEKEGKEQ